MFAAKPSVSLHTLLVTIASLVASIAAAAPLEPPTGPEPVLADRYPPQHVAFPQGVAGLANLVYITLPGFRPLTLDLYTPAAHPKPLPLIIYIHGGGWMAGHSRQSGAFENFPEVLASVAARGYVVAGLNYRLSGEATFPGAIKDVKAAIRWLRSKAPEYGIDRERVIVWGGSAGGQLAALAATTCGVKELDPQYAEPRRPDDAAASGESDCVQGAAVWYGIFDFAALAPPPGAAVDASAPPRPDARYLGCAPATCPAETLALSSAIRHVHRDTPPFLLVHGDHDTTVNPVQSTSFHAAMQAAGAPSELLMIPGVAHSFVGPTPKDTRDASLKALARTIDFFDRVTRAQAK